MTRAGPRRPRTRSSIHADERHGYAGWGPAGLSGDGSGRGSPRKFRSRVCTAGASESLGHVRQWGRLVSAVLLERLRLHIAEGRLAEADASLTRLDRLAHDHPAPSAVHGRKFTITPPWRGLNSPWPEIARAMPSPFWRNCAMTRTSPAGITKRHVWRRHWRSRAPPRMSRVRPRKRCRGSARPGVSRLVSAAPGHRTVSPHDFAPMPRDGPTRRGRKRVASVHRNADRARWRSRTGRLRAAA